MATVLDAKTLKKVFLAGTKRLDSKKEWINELNVFPVPDGDTGTNMTLTLMNAVKELQTVGEDADLDEVSQKISQGTLRGARGNSGVILSQLVRGFSKEIEGKSELTKPVFAAAFDRAVKTAYKAVMKPKEGTILTVARAVSERAAELCKKELSMDEFFTMVLAHAEDVLQQTPEMLPVLKEAGVVDSGGQGLVVFLSGALDAFIGKEVELASADAPFTVTESEVRVDTTNIQTADIKFGYCTEFIIELEKVFTDADEDAFKAFLMSIGDSIVCVSMDDIVKVHVHTNHPGEAIEKALTYGSLVNLKIDNMRVEHNEKVIKGLMKEESPTPAPQPRKEVGFVAVCSGEGLATIFKEMSVDEIIEGGQTMNPSTEDILEAVDKVNAEYVFVFPNNKNIVLAAQQAAILCEDKHLLVVPTTTVCEGINAIINYVPSLSVEENEARLKEAAQEVKTAEITYAIRDTEIEGTHIHNGDFMGIGAGHVFAAGKDLKEITMQTVQAMLEEDSELVSIYYGEDVTEEDAQAIADELEEALEDIDIEVTYGGQPVYYYIISVES